MAGSRMLDLMGPKMAGRDFAAGIEARLHQKDFGLVIEATQALGLSLPAAAIVSQQLNALVGNGWGRDDTSSLLRVLEGANRGRAANDE
jgi:3-hydroxyisobutyrate dehydrogenase-like beta-hydroxyacid dehydrogenase